MIARVVFPMLFQSLMNKAQNAAAQQQQYRRPYNPKPADTIHIDFVPPKDKEAKAADKAGDFVDYEEIKH
jgi:hypothetical protein